MSTPDLRASMPLRYVRGIDEDHARPGDVEPATDGTSVVELMMRCPGCGALSALPLTGTTPRWRIEAGDPRTGVGLTLSPSVHHLRGCGWHGWVRNGAWVPC